MKAKLLLLLKRPLYRYLIVGVSVYILELAVIMLAQHAAATPVIAVAVAFWVGLVVSFWLQKLVTFSDKRTHHRIVLSQFAAVCLLVLFNFCFTVLLTKLLQHMLPAWFIRTGALGVTVIWNFYLYKTRIFNIKDEPILS